MDDLAGVDLGREGLRIVHRHQGRRVMAQKGPMTTMNASEIRAALAPILNAYKSLALINDMAESMVVEEARLKTLVKMRADAEAEVNRLRNEHTQLLAQADGLRAQIAAAEGQHRV